MVLYVMYLIFQIGQTLLGGDFVLKRILCVCIFLMLSLTAICHATPVQSEKEHDITYVIHAAGKYRGFAGTNCLEALENAYADGNRYIELDFNFTQDLRPVCIHDWNHLAYSGFDGKRPTKDEFAENTVYGSFSSMTLESVADYMRKHEDLYIITDVKELNIYFMGIIQREFPDLRKRFIVQVYSELEYDFARRMKFDKIIFSLYKLDWKKQYDTDYLISFAKSHKLFAYTFNATLCDTEGYVENMLKCGIPLFVHTVNDKEEQKKYFDMGISGIYTDNTKH